MFVVLVVTLVLCSVALRNMKLMMSLKIRKVFLLLVFLGTFSFTTDVPTFPPAYPCVCLLQCTGVHSKAPKQQEIEEWTMNKK